MPPVINKSTAGSEKTVDIKYGLNSISTSRRKKTKTTTKNYRFIFPVFRLLCAQIRIRLVGGLGDCLRRLGGFWRKRHRWDTKTARSQSSVAPLAPVRSASDSRPEEEEEAEASPSDEEQIVTPTANPPTPQKESTVTQPMSKLGGGGGSITLRICPFIKSTINSSSIHGGTSVTAIHSIYNGSSAQQEKKKRKKIRFKDINELIHPTKEGKAKKEKKMLSLSQKKKNHDIIYNLKKKNTTRR